MGQLMYKNTSERRLTLSSLPPVSCRIRRYPLRNQERDDHGKNPNNRNPRLGKSWVWEARMKRHPGAKEDSRGTAPNNIPYRATVIIIRADGRFDRRHGQRERRRKVERDCCTTDPVNEHKNRGSEDSLGL